MTSPRGDEVLIAGAGIGGLATALFLARHGIASSVLERRTALDEAGAGIQLSPNASRLLIDLGLKTPLRRQAVTPERVVIRRARNAATIGEIALGASMEARFGAPYWVIHRADLHTILMDAVRSSPLVTLLVGRQVVGAVDQGGAVEVAIERANGERETRRAALLVGADGLRSACRRAVADGRSPVFRDATAWRATIPLDAAPDFARGIETGLWLGQNLHLVHYPVAAGRLLNIVAILAASEPVEDYGSQGDAGQIRASFRNAAKPLRDLVQRVQGWAVWSLHDLPVQRMAQGRIALVGDAGHPVLPYLAQGGALAIEDAAVLAAMLAATPHDSEAALAAYAAQRTDRVRRIQDEARRNGAIYHLRWPLALARDAVIARKGAEGMRDAYDWLYGWMPERPAQAA